MSKTLTAAAIASALSALVVALSPLSTASAQGLPDPRPLMAAQVEAMKALGAMNGLWRGPAWTLLPSGEKKTITQTERIGPMVQGSVKVVEGRGYDEQGALVFNAFGIISFDPATRSYSLRSYSQGRSADFALKLTEDGYAWEIPAGPATIRYTASIKDGVLRETGDRLMPGREPLRIFEMNLSRVGDSDWPSGGAVGPK